MANESVSDTVARRVREVRSKRRGLTVGELAARCAELGAPELTAQALYRLEQRGTASRRARPVTVDELLILAAALNVAPVHLLVPPDEADAPYQISAGVTENCFAARAWIRGIGPLDDDDPRQFYTEVPRDEYYIPAGGGQPGVQGRPGRQKGKGRHDGEH